MERITVFSTDIIYKVCVIQTEFVWNAIHLTRRFAREDKQKLEKKDGEKERDRVKWISQTGQGLLHSIR